MLNAGLNPSGYGLSSDSAIGSERDVRGGDVVWLKDHDPRFGDRATTTDKPKGRTWQVDALSRICRLLELKEGWDSYKAKAIPRETGMFALQILDAVMQQPSLSAPSIVPSPAGGIQLEWHTKSVDLELHISAVYDCEVWFEDRSTGQSLEDVVVDDFSILAGPISALVSSTSV
jgi:hypothetical protein